MQRLTGNQAHELIEAYQSIYEPQELTEEQLNEFFNLWVDGLINEGYDLSEFTYDELYDCYINENWGKVFVDAVRAGLRTGFKLQPGSVRKAIFARGVEGATRSGAHLASALKNIAIGSSAKGTGGKRRLGLILFGADQLANQGRATKAIWNAIPKGDSKPKKEEEPKYIPPASLTQEVDVVDLVKGHLMNEGYVNSEEDAYKIMANMSESWLAEIINSYTYIEE